MDTIDPELYVEYVLALEIRRSWAISCERSEDVNKSPRVFSSQLVVWECMVNKATLN